MLELLYPIGMDLDIFPPCLTLQVWLDPYPTIHVTTAPWGERLAVGTSAAGTSASLGNYRISHQISIQNIDFADISGSLTTLQVCEITSDQLTTLTGVPNLVQLDLTSCEKALSDLKGLAAVSRGCPKLKVLNLYNCKEEVECVEKLWEIMAAMANLRVLRIPLALVPTGKDEKVALPHLTAIQAMSYYFCRLRCTQVQEALDFLATIHSLRVFILDGKRKVFSAEQVL